MLFNILKPIIAVLLSAAFTRIVTLGYLTPQDAGALQKTIMDGVAIGVPALTAWWLAKGATPSALIKTVDALPQVEGVAVVPEVAQAITSPTVTVIESLPAAIAEKLG